VIDIKDIFRIRMEKRAAKEKRGFYLLGENANRDAFYRAGQDSSNALGRGPQNRIPAYDAWLGRG
jgi:hypothetical protein